MNDNYINFIIYFSLFILCILVVFTYVKKIGDGNNTDKIIYLCKNYGNRDYDNGDIHHLVAYGVQSNSSEIFRWINKQPFNIPFRIVIRIGGIKKFNSMKNMTEVFAKKYDIFIKNDSYGSHIFYSFAAERCIMDKYSIIKISTEEFWGLNYTDRRIKIHNDIPENKKTIPEKIKTLTLQFIPFDEDITNIKTYIFIKYKTLNHSNVVFPSEGEPHYIDYPPDYKNIKNM